MVFFTDGSFILNKGCGSAAICDRVEATTSLGPLSSVSNDEAELVAIRLAIRSFQAHQRLNPSLHTVSIFSDSQSAIRAIHNPTNCKSNQYIISTLKALISHATYPTCLRMFWTPGHEGIELNEQADAKARETALSRTEDIKPDTNLSSLKRMINTTFKSNPNYFKTSKPLLFKTPPKKIWNALAKLEKGRASVIFQLRSGHIALNAYLHRFSNKNLILSPNCKSC